MRALLGRATRFVATAARFLVPKELPHAGPRQFNGSGQGPKHLPAGRFHCNVISAHQALLFHVVRSAGQRHKRLPRPTPGLP